MSGCTNCSEKAGCSHRKGDMFAALDRALANLYPSRRWGELSPLGWKSLCPSEQAGKGLAEELSAKLSAWVRFRPGEEEDFCDYLEVLCLGRRPCLFDLEAGQAELSQFETETREVYLRVCLSRLDALATVQQVTLTLDHEPQGPEDNDGQACLIEEPRAGVYDGFLLDRLQRIVAWLPEKGYLSVDFGDITTPPEGFDAGEYRTMYGEAPAMVNYLFYGPPSTMQRIFTVPAWLKERAEASL